MTIKFNIHNVIDTKTRIKARVHYSLGKLVNDERQCVTIYEKDYERNLHKIFQSAINDTDTMTDYFENSRVRIFEDDELFKDVLKTCKRITEKEIAKGYDYAKAKLLKINTLIKQENK